jgi:hypothetical protein
MFTPMAARSLGDVPHGVTLGKTARASYATYVIHPLVLTAVMVAFASAAPGT